VLPGLDDLQSLQSGINRETAAGWGYYRSHRAAVMRLLEEKVPRERPDAGCILGAGNGNDLDLRRLTELCPVVHLVDVDRAAVSRAVSRCSDIRHRLVVHAPYDLTGLAARAVARPSDAGAAENIVRTALSTVPAVGVARESCGVVVSASVFSQLVATLSLVVSPDSPTFSGLVTVLRATHVHLMLSLLAPGATGIFVGELASSDLCPALVAARPHELARLARRLVEERNFFTGMNPFALAATALGTAVRDGRARDVTIHAPWIWRLSPARCYLAYAVSFTKT